jgi:hypothetical protein
VLPGVQLGNTRIIRGRAFYRPISIINTTVNTMLPVIPKTTLTIQLGAIPIGIILVPFAARSLDAVAGGWY